jgi:hypothetical protein
MSTTTTFESILRDEYTRRDVMRDDKFDPYDLADPIKPPPPQPTETLDGFKTRIEAIFPPLPEPINIRSYHPIVHKLLAYDKKVVAEQKRGGFDRPSYQDEKGRLSLEWLNALLHHFTLLGFSVYLRGRKYFRFDVKILGSTKEFVFFVNETRPLRIRAKEKSRRPARTYCFKWENDSDSYRRRDRYYEFQAVSTDAIKQIVVDALVSHENRYRENITWRYERDVETRNDLLRTQQRQRERIARRKRLSIMERLTKRDELITTAISGMNSADRIRELVAVIRLKSGSSKKPIENLDRWARWATHYANTIDARHMSMRGLNAWIAKFKLKQ